MIAESQNGGRKEDKESSSRENSRRAVKEDAQKEVRIVGNISYVYIEGRESYSKTNINREELLVNGRSSKKKIKNYIIVPIEEKNSTIQFIKVPVFKLSKRPKAQKIGYVRCRKLESLEEERPEEDLVRWWAEKNEIHYCRRSTEVYQSEYRTCFMSEQVFPRERSESEKSFKAVPQPVPLAFDRGSEVMPSEREATELPPEVKETEFKYEPENEAPHFESEREQKNQGVGFAEGATKNEKPSKAPEPEERKSSREVDISPSTSKVLSYLITSKNKNAKKKRK